MNIYAYRLPRKKRIKAACSGQAKSGIYPDSFVVAPFRSGHECVSIPEEQLIRINDLDAAIAKEYGRGQNPDAPFPAKSTTREEHAREVISFAESISKGEMGKCVAARVIVRQERISPSAIFLDLCDRYPDAFVFLFHTEKSGTWIGASPEILMKKKGEMIRTMALAGTREAHSQEFWSKKNIHEHRAVVDFISGIFKRHGQSHKISEPKIVVAGPVEHLMTGIKAIVDDNDRVEEILRDLSPTPALAGMPRDRALQEISRHEAFERGYYGGFMGPVSENGDFLFHVNLRSMRYEPGRYALFVGGGIMEESDPDSEWDETERKAETLLSVIDRP